MTAPDDNSSNWERSDEVSASALNDEASLHPERQLQRLSLLYYQHGKAIVSGLRKAFGDGPPDPEDITQQAFQKLLERQDLTEIDNIKGYLWRTARNLVLKYKRSASVRSKYDYEIENLYFAMEWDETNPERIIEAKDQLVQIEACLQAMPIRRRRCFVLHKVDGLSVVQISEKLIVPKSTVHREIMKAAVEIDLHLQRKPNGEQAR